MKSLVERFRSIGSKNLADKLQDDEQLARQVMALFTMLSELYGPDKLVLKAGKLDALELMRSSRIEDRVLALQRLVFEDPTIEAPPSPDGIEAALSSIEEEIADIVARRRLRRRSSGASTIGCSSATGLRERDQDADPARRRWP